jgi:hypothetical protein
VTEFDIERWMLMRRLGLENQIFLLVAKAGAKFSNFGDEPAH